MYKDPVIEELGRWRVAGGQVINEARRSKELGL